MKYINRLIVILSTLLSIISCGGGVKPNATTLTDINWKLVSMNGIPFNGKTQPTLSFGLERAAGFSGCNRYFSHYTASRSGRIAFSSIGSTKKRCHRRSARMLERQMMSGLRTANSFHLNQGRLTIEGTSGLLQFEK
jgi:heat shock protein HslJ